MTTTSPDYAYVSGAYRLANENYNKLFLLVLRQAPLQDFKRAVLEYAKDLMFYDEAFRIMHPEYELPDLDVDPKFRDLLD